MKRLKIMGMSLFLAVAPANADFTLRPDETGAGATDAATAGEAPHTEAASPPSSDVQSQPSFHPASRKHIPRTPVARGFGDQIPLSFAVRQIVPPTIKIRIGRGIDPTTLVDWKGGHEWPTVLREAIRPLKLQLAVHPSAATIYDPKNQ